MPHFYKRAKNLAEGDERRKPFRAACECTTLLLNRFRLLSVLVSCRRR